MSSRGPVSGRETLVALKRAGFSQVSQRGSHVKLSNNEGRVVIVPMHRELAPGTLASILRQAGIGRSEFDELFR